MHVERLLKLADFLRNNLDEKLWFFGTIISQGTKQPNAAYEAGGVCGTVGCAIGWCPKIFPDEWEWATLNEGIFLSRDVVRLRDSKLVDFVGAARFFEITRNQATFLFHTRGYFHCEDTTKEEVASRIERFVKGLI